MDAQAAQLEDKKAHDPPLLASLSSQLYSERRRREDAEQQVALLSAQVARREADLEARLDPGNDGRSDGAMMREAALGVLEPTIARYRVLAEDVKVLVAKLKPSLRRPVRLRRGPRSSSRCRSAKRLRLTACARRRPFRPRALLLFAERKAPAEIGDFPAVSAASAIPRRKKFPFGSNFLGDIFVT